MQVILLERVEKLGQMGDVVNVKPGFARNFLLPQQKALRATKDNLSSFEEQKAKLESENADRRGLASTDAEKLKAMIVTLIRQAGDAGQLYGSVSARDIAKEASTSGVTVDKRQVRLEQPIKALGLYPIRVDLHPEVSVTITANVARSTEEAKMQAKTGKAVNRSDEEDEAPPALPKEAEAEQIFENPDEETQKLADKVTEAAESVAAEKAAASTKQVHAPVEVIEDEAEKSKD